MQGHIRKQSGVRGHCVCRYTSGNRVGSEGTVRNPQAISLPSCQGVARTQSPHTHPSILVPLFLLRAGEGWVRNSISHIGQWELWHSWLEGRGKVDLGAWRKETWGQCSLGHSPLGNTFLRDTWNPDPVPVLFPKFLDRDGRVPEKPLYTRSQESSLLALGLGATCW